MHIMMNKLCALKLALGLLVMLVSLRGECYGALQVGFYKGKCGFTDVESLVFALVRDRFFKDRTLVAALLRMQFHDCFVNGCDASILLNGNSSEKTAPPNLSVRGYDVIDAVKAAVEAKCPGVVSCADIITMATRDVVFLAGGFRYSVETGRRDGLISLASNVDLPSPTISVSDSIAAFAKKNISATDMVYLLGGHTVGIAHCFLFQDRLYNFQNTGQPDPTMDPTLLGQLRLRCPQGSSGNFVNLDQNWASSLIVDQSYYQQIVARRGILQIDQDLALDPQTRDLVTKTAFGFGFSSKFSAAMVKLGRVDVLIGTDGEIRKTCGAVN